jgi:hypothetical protein
MRIPFLDMAIAHAGLREELLDAMNRVLSKGCSFSVRRLKPSRRNWLSESDADIASVWAMGSMP